MSLARAALEYVWCDPSLWQLVTLHDHDTLGDLCGVAVEAALAPIIRQWLEVEVAADKNVLGERLHAWRGSMLRSLVQAHLHSNIQDSADMALRCLFDMMDRKEQVNNDYITRRDAGEDSPPSGVWYLSMFPTIIRLEYALSRFKWPNTNPKLFDRFAGLISNLGHKRSEDETRLMAANLLMYHPKHPQVTKAILCYREYFGSDRSQEKKVVASMDPKYQAFMRRHLGRALQLAERDGASEDAAWLGGIIEHHFSDIPRRSRGNGHSGNHTSATASFRRISLEQK